MTYPSGPGSVRTRSAENNTAKALAISAPGAAKTMRSAWMLSTLLVSTTSRLKYCSVHQRAWVDRWANGWLSRSRPCTGARSRKPRVTPVRCSSSGLSGRSFLHWTHRALKAALLPLRSLGGVRHMGSKNRPFDRLTVAHAWHVTHPAWSCHITSSVPNLRQNCPTYGNCRWRQSRSAQPDAAR